MIFEYQFPNIFKKYYNYIFLTLINIDYLINSFLKKYQYLNYCDFT